MTINVYAYDTGVLLKECVKLSKLSYSKNSIELKLYEQGDLGSESQSERHNLLRISSTSLGRDSNSTINWNIQVKCMHT